MGADPTWPNRARYSIPCDVTLGSGGGSGAAGTHSRLGAGAAPVRFRESGCCTVRGCVFSLFVSLLFLFPSVCCSVKLPLSRPTSFCLFLSILLRTPAGVGAAAWRFCCWRQPKPRHRGAGSQPLLGLTSARSPDLPPSSHSPPKTQRQRRRRRSRPGSSWSRTGNPRDSLESLPASQPLGSCSPVTAPAPLRRHVSHPASPHALRLRWVRDPSWRSCEAGGCGEGRRGQGEGLHLLARTRSDGFKQREGGFRLDIRRIFFTVRVVKPWRRLPREVVNAPSLETFKVRLDGAVSNLIQLKMSLLMTRGLGWMTSKGPFPPKPS